MVRSFTSGWTDPTTTPTVLGGTASAVNPTVNGDAEVNTRSPTSREHYAYREMGATSTHVQQRVLKMIEMMEKMKNQKIQESLKQCQG